MNIQKIQEEIGQRLDCSKPFVFKNGDRNLALFSMKDDIQGLTITSFSLLPDGKRLFPLGFAPDASGLRRFLNQRLLPRNRAYSMNLTLNCGFNLRNKAELLAFSRGLSLTDDFWIAYSSEENYSNVSFRLNPLNRELAHLALTGHGLPSRPSLSPEWTSPGVMPKAWVRKDGALYLYKGSTIEGAEPYSEYYASSLAAFLGVNVVTYDLTKLDGAVYSKCPLLVGADDYFAPAAWLFPGGDIAKVRDYCLSQGEDWLTAFTDMMVLDFLLANGDRHFRNFGILVDKATNEAKGFAPFIRFRGWLIQPWASFQLATGFILLSTLWMFRFHFFCPKPPRRKPKKKAFEPKGFRFSQASSLLPSE